MFTGIIEEIGTVASIRQFGNGRRIEIATKKISEGTRIGESISINGVCLTIVRFQKNHFTVEAVEETLKKTTIGKLKHGSEVNLERALQVGDRLGGHFLQGHVDCTGTIIKIEKRKESWAFWFSFPPVNKKYIIQRGSIAIDGVSLTVADIKVDLIMISIIPYTFHETIFHSYKKRGLVNIEFDFMGKYILGAFDIEFGKFLKAVKRT